MEKIIVFAMGQKFNAIKKWIFANYDVVALTDNNEERRREWQSDELIVRPDDIVKHEFDSIMICTEINAFARQICKQLLSMGIPNEKIIFPIYNIMEHRLNSVVNINGVRIKINYFTDLMVLNEIMYGITYPPPSADSDFVLIDVGMNIGTASLFYAKYNNIKNVYSYELIKQTYQMALQNFKLNPKISYKIKAFPFGLSDKNEVMQLEVTEAITSGIIFRRASHETEPLNIINDCEVKRASETLYDIISKHKGKEKLMMKIDCEGAEWLIFDDLAQSGLLSAFDVIVGEWHISRWSSYDKEEVLQKFKSQLKDSGLTITEWNEGFTPTIGLFRVEKI
jgi:FkbM family methyltransferase